MTPSEQIDSHHFNLFLKTQAGTYPIFSERKLTYHQQFVCKAVPLVVSSFKIQEMESEALFVLKVRYILTITS